jgi:hypothetical protein
MLPVAGRAGTLRCSWATPTPATSADAGDLLRWATRIGGRYMGAGRAEEFGRRNGVPPELVVRVTPAQIVAKVDIAD